MDRVDARRLVRMRLVSQRISASEFTTVAEVVRWMTAMQAQDFASAQWSVGLRLPGSTQSVVNAALIDGTIVRSWPMRGTLHFVAPEDLGWILGLTSERLIKGAAARRAALGLTEELLEATRAAVIEALTGGVVLTRDEMYAVFERAGVSPGGQRGYHVLWYLSQSGTLCFGPPDKKQQTFVLFDEWIRDQRELERDEALGEFALRYFRSHGPATIRDFAWWSSTTLTAARIGLAIAGDSLSRFERDGESYYCSADAVRDPAPDGVRALPGFDEYLLGYQDRRPQLAEEHSQAIIPGGNGVFLRTIVRDGTVVGTWKRTLSSRGVSITAQPFSSMNGRLENGFARAGNDYARFLSMKAIRAPA